MQRFAWTLVAALIVFAPLVVAMQRPDPPQGDLAGRIDELDSRLDRLQGRVRQGTSGGVLFLFGAFCALWAQNTRRSAWGWFFLGVFFNVITVLVLLYKNAEDLAQAEVVRPGEPGA